MSDNDADKAHKPYITVTHGGSGFFAVCIWWNPEGFSEPWQTGIGRYRDSKHAVVEARQWAEAEGLEFRE